MNELFVQNNLKEFDWECILYFNFVWYLLFIYNSNIIIMIETEKRNWDNLIRNSCDGNMTHFYKNLQYAVHSISLHFVK